MYTQILVKTYHSKSLNSGPKALISISLIIMCPEQLESRDSDSIADGEPWWKAKNPHYKLTPWRHHPLQIGGGGCKTTTGRN